MKLLYTIKYKDTSVKKAEVAIAFKGYFYYRMPNLDTYLREGGTVRAFQHLNSFVISLTGEPLTQEFLNASYPHI